MTNEITHSLNAGYVVNLAQMHDSCELMPLYMPLLDIGTREDIIFNAAMHEVNLRTQHSTRNLRQPALQRQS